MCVLEGVGLEFQVTDVKLANRLRGRLSRAFDIGCSRYTLASMRAPFRNWIPETAVANPSSSKMSFGISLP